MRYMRKAPDSLGEFEQLVLTSMLLLGEHAYGLAMHAKISELAAPRNVRLGAVSTKDSKHMLLIEQQEIQI